MASAPGERAMSAIARKAVGCVRSCRFTPSNAATWHVAPARPRAGTSMGGS